jgi:hypothetical protein
MIVPRPIVGTFRANISELDAIISSSRHTITEFRASSGTLDAFAPARPACGHGAR